MKRKINIQGGIRYSWLDPSILEIVGKSFEAFFIGSGRFVAIAQNHFPFFKNRLPKLVWINKEKYC